MVLVFISTVVTTPPPLVLREGETLQGALNCNRCALSAVCFGSVEVAARTQVQSSWWTSSGISSTVSEPNDSMSGGIAAQTRKLGEQQRGFRGCELN